MIIKMVLVGDMYVGKTCLARMLIGEPYSGQQVETIGVDFHLMQVKGEQVQIWDTAGNPRFAPIMNSYIHSAHVILFCFSATEAWFAQQERFRTFMKTYDLAAKKVVMVLTKTDADASHKQVALSQLHTLSREMPERVTACVQVSSRLDQCAALRAQLCTLITGLQEQWEARDLLAQPVRLALQEGEGAPPSSTRGLCC